VCVRVCVCVQVMIDLWKESDLVVPMVPYGCVTLAFEVRAGTLDMHGMRCRTLHALSKVVCEIVD
jgi:hypothetical protein